MENSAVDDAGIEDLSTQTNPTQVSSPKECVFHLTGYGCSFGEKCRFNHPVLPDAKADEKENTKNAPGDKTKPCKLFLLGKCKYGSYCTNSHVLDLDDFNSHGLPLRPTEPECSYFMRTGTCKYGALCKYNHPERPFNPQGYDSYVYGNAGYDQYQYGYQNMEQNYGCDGNEQAYGWNGNEGTSYFNYEGIGGCAYESSCSYDQPPKWAPSTGEASTSQSASVGN